jgi:diguanylate cyclase (GGDEF)-like protein
MAKYHLYRPSRILFLILFIVLLFFIFNGFYIYLVYNDTKINTIITDLFSQLRVNIEKAGSMELLDANADAVIVHVNGLFENLESTLDHISPLSQNQNTALQLDELRGTWRRLRDTLGKYNLRKSDSLHAQIIDLTESCEVLIDNLFSGTQGAMDQQEQILLTTMLIFIGINLFLVGLIALIVNWYIKGKLEYMATYDQLTVLFNRYAYRDILEKEIAQAIRNRSRLTLILFDIDHFKHINDTHGHDTGDQVLKFVARTVNACIRKSDYLFRIGGEEFAIIAANTSMEHAVVLAEKIRQTIEELKYRDDCPVTLSFGVAELRNGEGVDELFRKADAAQYKAKNSGRNRVETNS